MLIAEGREIRLDASTDLTEYDYFYGYDLSPEDRNKLQNILELPAELILEGLSHTESRRIFTTKNNRVVAYLYAPVKAEEHTYYIEPIIMISSQAESIFLSQKEVPFIHQIAHQALIKNISASSLNEIVDKYLDVLGQISLDIQELIVRIKKKPKESDLLRVFSLQVSITQIDSAIDSLNLILEQGVETKIFLSQPEVADAKLQLKHAARTVDTYLSILQSSIDLIEGMINNRLNDIMKFLTAMTVVLSIPMIIAGFWGMNVPVPLGSHPYGFVYLLFFSLIVSLLTTWYLIKRNFF